MECHLPKGAYCSVIHGGEDEKLPWNLNPCLSCKLFHDAPGGRESECGPMKFEITKIFRFKSGKGGSAIVCFSEELNVQYRIVKARDGGKVYAFAPQEEKREGKEKAFNLVWFKSADQGREVTDAVIKEYLSSGEGVEDASAPTEEAPF